MYAGEIVETAPPTQIHRAPQHPYTQGLMQSFPPLTGPIVRLTGIPGSPPDLGDPPAGCRFHPRCLHCRPENADALPAADDVRPRLREVAPGAPRRLSPRGGAVTRPSCALEVAASTKHFPVGGASAARSRCTRSTTSLRAAAGHDHRARRRERQRQEHGRAPARAAVRADRAARHLRGRGRRAHAQPARAPRYRSQVQMIFQDPFGSLNPVKTVRHHLERPLRIHRIVPRDEIDERVHELLDTVGLVPPAEFAAKYPHELSGGQRQRVAIARALAVEPTCVAGRRADLDARRLDPHRDPEPDARAEGASASSRSSTSRTTSRAPATSPTRSSSCMRARSSSRARPSRCSRARCTRTRDCCSPLSPIPARDERERDRGAQGPRRGGGRPARRLPLRRPLSARDRRLLAGHARSSSRRARARARAATSPPRPRSVRTRTPCRASHQPFPPDFIWGAATAVVPDRGRGERGRPRRERLGPLLRDARQGAQRRHRRGRVRLLPPLPRRHRADARARPRRVPLLDRLAARAAGGPRAR